MTAAALACGDWRQCGSRRTQCAQPRLQLVNFGIERSQEVSWHTRRNLAQLLRAREGSVEAAPVTCPGFRYIQARRVEVELLSQARSRSTMSALAESAMYAASRSPALASSRSLTML